MQNNDPLGGIPNFDDEIDFSAGLNYGEGNPIVNTDLGFDEGLPVDPMYPSEMPEVPNPLYKGELDYTGNIDIDHRPRLENEDGSFSTVESISFGDENGKEIVVPTIINGKRVSKDEAIAHYYKTGENLGKFDSVKEAEEFAKSLSKRQGDFYNSNDVNATLKQNEGFRDKVYKDTQGYDTIGYGHKLTEEDKRTGRFRNGVSQEEAQKLFEEDEASHTAGLYRVAPWAQKQPKVVQDVLRDMAYNMGPNFIKEWPTFARQLQQGNYKAAAANMLNTAYADQVKGRAVRNAQKLRNL